MPVPEPLPQDRRSNTLFQPYRSTTPLTPREPFHDGPLTRCMAGPGLVPTEQMAPTTAAAPTSASSSPKPPSSVRTGRATPIPWALQRRTDRRLEKVTSAVHASGGKDLRPAVARGPSLPPLLPPRRKCWPLPPSPMRARCRCMRELVYQVPRALTGAKSPSWSGLRPGRRQRHRGGL